MNDRKAKGAGGKSSLEIAHRNDRAAVAEQRVDHAMNQEPPKRLTDPRAAYDARTTQIHAKLAQPLQLADDHFGHDADTVHWGHAGDPGQVEPALIEPRSIFDSQSE
jgi:hypothetical protein